MQISRNIVKRPKSNN